MGQGDKPQLGSVVASATGHLIIPKRICLVTILVATGVFGGILASNRFYARRVERFLADKKRLVKDQNQQLEKEQQEYKALFASLSATLEQDVLFGGTDEPGGSGDQPVAGSGSRSRPSSLRKRQRESAENFRSLAKRLMEALEKTQDLLEDKEFQLWEKEGLLDYWEERVLNTEDLEVEMAGYINQMAAELLARNKTLPAGLAEEIYFAPRRKGPTSASASAEGADAAEKGDTGADAYASSGRLDHRDGWHP